MEGVSFSPQQVQQLNEMAVSYARYLQNSLNQAAQKGKFNVTGSLQNSIQVSYTQATATEFPSFTVSYALHGKIIEIKRMIWTGQPPVEQWKEWVLANKRMSGFSKVPGYKGTAPISREAAAERIAWAMSKSRLKTNKAKNTYAWKSGRKNSPMGNALGYINHLVAEITADMVVKAIVQPLTAK